jgi:cytochrome b
MQTTNEDSINVWDLPLRIFHWLLVVSFFTAYVTEDDFLTAHVWAGYFIAGLLVFRLIWGFVGGHYARFSNFLCSPSESITYFKDLIRLNAKRYIGHNPAGSAMIVLLLLSILMTIITGLALYGADQGAGLLAFINKSQEHFWKEIHEFFANFTVVLVVVHVIGVAVESYIHRENLARAMVHGNKRKP